MTKMLRKDDMSKSIGITNEVDFSVGYLLGDLVRGYFLEFLSRNSRYPNKEEQDEFWNIVVSRMPQIKGVIHQAG